MRAKTGGVDDEMHDESDKEEKKRTVWSRHKGVYYNTENVCIYLLHHLILLAFMALKLPHV